MDPRLNWNDLRYFLAVARTQTLSEAARRLGVSTSTVSRRIVQLQHALGTALFTRRQEGYELNETGAALLPAAEEAEANLLWLQRAVAEDVDEARGVVRVATPELLGEHLILPALGGLSRRYPDIRLELLSDVRPARLSKRDADILVRLVRPAQGDYTVRRLGRIALGLYGSRDYVAQSGRPRHTAELGGHRLIGWDMELGYLPLARWLEERAPGQPLQLRLGTLNAQLSAVAADLGLAVLPCFAAERRGLVRVLETEPLLRMDIWLLQQTASRRLRRVQVVAEHIADTVASAREALDRAD